MTGIPQWTGLIIIEMFVLMLPVYCHHPCVDGYK